MVLTPTSFNKSIKNKSTTVNDRLSSNMNLCVICLTDQSFVIYANS